MNLKPLGDRLIVEVLEEEETTTSGIVARATSISRQWMCAMKASEPAASKTVFEAYMIAGPQSMRTACRSLVARAMRSPV